MASIPDSGDKSNNDFNFCPFIFLYNLPKSESIHWFNTIEKNKFWIVFNSSIILNYWLFANSNWFRLYTINSMANFSICNFNSCCSFNFYIMYRVFLQTSTEFYEIINYYIKRIRWFWINLNNNFICIYWVS